MYKDGSGRTLSTILFSRKRGVDGYSWLRGDESIDVPARRNPGNGRLSAILAKSVLVMLKGDVISISRLVEGGVLVRSVSQSGGPPHACTWLDDRPAAYLPHGAVTYHLGVLAFAEALVRREEARDLLDAWELLLTEHATNGGSIDATLRGAIATAADELYYWLRYTGAITEPPNDRLAFLAIEDNTRSPAATPAGTIDVTVLTDRAKLRRYRVSGESEAESAAVMPAPGPAFRGWQLGELVASLDAGLNCLLIGHTGTGKSLCVAEAHERLSKPRRLFIIEGHSSLKEFDLLGGYVPSEGGFTWKDGIVTQALRDRHALLFIDEANRMPARVLNLLLGILSRGAVVLTEHGSEVVRAGDGFCVVMASNLGRGYHVEGFDAALVSRFPVVLEFHYLPARDEEQLLHERTGIDPAVAKVMVKVANETRRLRRSHELAGCIDTRGLLAWATKFATTTERSETNLAARLKASARITVFYAACGTDSDGYIKEESATLLASLIDAHTPR